MIYEKMYILYVVVLKKVILIVKLCYCMFYVFNKFYLVMMLI